jgi:zinc protease
MASHVHEQVLDNGLRVLVQDVRTAPLASVWCWYRVGSKDEGPGLTGVSHWVEHMNFKGTTNIPRDKVKGIIEQFGGYWNGYTWIDQTTYTETATRDALDRMLFIESERMANCLYDPADCESERTVIISELQGGENDPDTLLDQELTATAFRAHTYRHPTIGWLADLETMTREDLYGYYRRHYVPNNATLVIVGDVDTKAAMERVDHHFGRIVPGDVKKRPVTKEPEQLGERRVTVSREGTTAYLKLGYHAPSLGDADFFPMLVLDAVLTGAKGVNLWASFRTPPPQRSARLYRALVNTGLASSVMGGVIPTEDPFLYTISITATEGTPLDRVEAAAIAELDRVRAEGITPAELTKARTQLRARLVFENDSITNIAHQLGYFQTIADWRVFPSLRERIDAVTVEQVSAAAAARLAPSNRTVGWFDPIPVSA